MWVEVDHDKVATSFNKYDKIRVEIDKSGHDWEGLFVKYESKGPYVHLTQPGSDYPVCLYVWPGRKFYRWEEDKPTDSTNRLDQSKLRLHNPERAKKLHAHVGEIIAEQAEVPLRKAYVRINGTSTYALREGEHLSVWWEDGRLHTELVQE